MGENYESELVHDILETLRVAIGVLSFAARVLRLELPFIGGLIA
jgi:hypothetical protein